VNAICPAGMITGIPAESEKTRLIHGLEEVMTWVITYQK